MPRVTYLFRAGRRERMAECGEIPTEFFYGFQQLKRLGWEAEFLEDADLGMGPRLSWIATLLNKTSRFLGGFPVGMATALVRREVRNKLNEAGILVATTTGLGLVVAFGKMLGLLHRPVVFLAMGVLPAQPTRMQNLVILPHLRHLDMIVFSIGEQRNLKKLLPDQEIFYVPFGVDGDFWFPLPNAVGGDYVLAIGNDPHRDWNTLVAAWTLDLPPLMIVTKLPVPPASDNVNVVNGDWRTQSFSDRQIRNLYHGARFVIVPVCQTLQPSGQSTCLQAMACGKAVILSDIDGLWDRNLMVNGETVILVPPEDAGALNSAVRVLVADATLRNRIAVAGRRVVEEHLNVKKMSAALLVALEQAHG